MSWIDTYQTWLEKADSKTIGEMKKMTDKEKEECFAVELAFGTGGMRGILGAGINRMNVYTVRKATYGFAKYLERFNAKDRGVVIAHDNRHMSKEFALETAKVFASMGFKAYLFENLRPTPELSFGVRFMHAIAGVMITASHNPKEYNGYKIYDEDGCQLTPDKADLVIDEIGKIEDVFAIESDKNPELIEILGKNVDQEYIKLVDTVTINPDLKKNFKVVYTPLHGTGSVFVADVLKNNGFNVTPVASQMVNDPNFSATKNANPEEQLAFEEAIKLGEKIDATLLLATDPDADRVGIAVKHGGEYILLNGNQTGAIMLNYILTQRKKNGTLPQNGYVFTTNVSSPLGLEIAHKYGLNTKVLLTGFKFIGEQAKILEKTDGEYVFGSEESYGYLIKDFVRDKDSVQASLLICEICAYYNEKGMTLVDALEEIYQEYGYYSESLKNIHLKGLDGAKKIKDVMNYFRTNELNIDFDKLVAKEDNLLKKRFENGNESLIDLPKSNVIKYQFSDSSWFVLRPSGTEPKLKIYFGVKGNNHLDSELKMKTLRAKVIELIEGVIEC